MLTPGVYTYDDMALSDERGKMKERKGMVVFHLEEIYIIVEKWKRALNQNSRIIKRTESVKLKRSY